MLGGPHRQPPPSATTPGDDRNVRCGCGFAYNGYKWQTCPACHTDETGMWALGCRECRNTWFGAERVDHCPECDSGNTTVISSPETPANV